MIRKRLLSLGIAICMTASLFVSAASSVSSYNDPPKKIIGHTTYGELVRKTDFKDGKGLPWTTVETLPGKASYEVSNGTYNVTVEDPGANKWDVQLRHRGIHIELNHTYTFKFTVAASKDSSLYAKVGDQSDPYDEYWNNNWTNLNIGTAPKTVTGTFVNNKRDQPYAEIAFHLGNGCSTVGTTYKFTSVSLMDKDFPGYPIYEEASSDIRINQLGYLVQGEKKATLVTSSTTSVPWALKDNTGTTVAIGTTIPLGLDKDSGDNVQIIDFSSYIPPRASDGYTLTAGNATSFKFSIINSGNLYSPLLYEALKYFYHNRSGINKELPYCEDKAWVRTASNLPDKATTKDGSSTSDITGGWYDAGDNGKDVVNGAISAWTLMNLYERAMNQKTTYAYDDSTMGIPESGDKIPDLLNEVRWEMEMLLKFQIKSGSQAGLCYQGANDTELHVLSLAPSSDKLISRLLNPPTTSATLGLAASAAQASRIFKNIDPSFSEETLKQAEAAWDAAVANPKLYKVDSTYGTIVTGTDDEFYWAACELYATTGSSKYLQFIMNSKYYLKMPVKLYGGDNISLDGVFNTENTEGLGTITLALAQNSLPADDIQKARENIVAAADNFLSIQSTQGYGTTIKSTYVEDGLIGYPFESNSYVLNIAMVTSYAYDFTRNIKYINSVLESLDYILGRNPNQQCYVTGFGTRPLQNPHHLSFAYQDDNSLPKPPPGFVSGGPATILSRPEVSAPEYNPGEMPPQKNFSDNFDSWSTNGVNINLNASFAWVAGYINEIRPVPPPPTSSPSPLPFGGDLNDDMKINSTDASILKRVILGSFTGYYNKNNADINCDGKINSSDYVLLKRKIIAIS